MRRYIAYISLMSALLVGIGVSSAPAISKVQTDLAYSEGKTLYFKATKNNNESLTNNYGDFLTKDDFDGSGLIIDHLAETVKNRLDNWNLSEYSVQVQGYDTIAVSLRAGGATDEDQYNYLSTYLAFSGQNFTLDSSDDHFIGDSELSEILDNQTAWIQEIEMAEYNVPVVCMPLNQSYKTKFNDLIQYCKDNSTEADEDAGTKANTINVVVWGNRGENDKYTSEDSENLNKIGLKIVSVVNAENATWYKDNDEDKETPYLQLIPYSSAINNGQYDPSKGQQAYEAAVYLRNMMNASKLQYSGTDYRLTYVYSEVASAAVENIFSYSSAYYQYGPAFSKTLISALVAFILIVLVLVLFNRILGLMQATLIAGSIFLTFLVFVYFGAQFNIAALLGFAIVGLVAAFDAVIYSHKLKDELYKGRTLKKAQKEAVKRATWPTVDAGILTVIIGIFVFAFAGDLATKLGTVLVVGGFISTILALILLRIGGWMLCTDSFMAANFQKQLGVDGSKIPDLTKEEKQSYFGPYEKRNFAKGKLLVSIISLAFILGGIGTMIGFGVANNGNVYNTSSVTANYTVLRLDVKSNTDEKKNISETNLRNVDVIKGGTTDGSDIFHSVKINGKLLADAIPELKLSDSSHAVYVNDSENRKFYYFYYTGNMNDFVDPSKKITLSVYENNAWADKSDNISDLTTLGEEITEYMSDNFVIHSMDADTGLWNYYLTFNTVSPEVGQPYFGRVLLALGVGCAVAMVYMMLRYRPSRGFLAGLAAFATGFISMGFFSMTRISVTPAVSLGCIAGALLVFLLSLFIFNGEKEVIAADHTADKKSFEFRSDSLKTALGRNAGAAIVLALCAAYVFISLFAFGPSTYGPVFLSAIIGLAFGIALVLAVVVPGSILGAKLLSKIKIKRKPKKAKNLGGNLGKTGKSDNEPKEAIFIGIND